MEKLQLRFDPRTIEHLGIKMYSQLPYALAELVANAYDAGADNVLIKLYDNDPNNKRIVIIDDGDGMSYDEVGEKFLVIGRKAGLRDVLRR
ncbi:MAG: ATP-binding protein [Lentisphaeria bacterium]|nr:ATP-binding protein [Lentisphaeria bacterium]